MRDYYNNPKRRVGDGPGRPVLFTDEDLLNLLPATVGEAAGRLGVTPSAVYYRLRAMMTEGTVCRTAATSEVGRRQYVWRRT